MLQKDLQNGYFLLKFCILSLQMTHKTMRQRNMSNKRESGDSVKRALRKHHYSSRNGLEQDGLSRTALHLDCLFLNKPFTHTRHLWGVRLWGSARLAGTDSASSGPLSWWRTFYRGELAGSSERGGQPRTLCAAVSEWSALFRRSQTGRTGGLHAVGSQQKAEDDIIPIPRESLKDSGISLWTPRWWRRVTVFPLTQQILPQPGFLTKGLSFPVFLGNRWRRLKLDTFLLFTAQLQV